MYIRPMDTPQAATPTSPAETMVVNEKKTRGKNTHMRPVEIRQGPPLPAQTIETNEKKPGSKKLLIVIVVILFIILIVLFGLFFLLGGGKLIETFHLRFSPVLVKRGDVKTQLLFPGTTDFLQRSVLEFQQVPTTGTKIAYIGVKVGDIIKKGMLIASLDSEAVLKQQQKNLAAYLKQRANYDQIVANSGGIPQNDTTNRQILGTQSDLSSSVYDVELQDQTLRFSTIISPIDGIVTRADAQVAGINISSNDEVKFEVINPLTLFFSVDIDESEVVNLHKSDTGFILLNAFPGDPAKAIVNNIAFAPHADSNGNMVYTVKLLFDNKNNSNYQYKLGMTGNVVFYTWAQNVLTLSKAYIHEDDVGTFVRVGGNKKKTYIQTGISDGTNTEIVRGLFENEEVYY